MNASEIRTLFALYVSNEPLTTTEIAKEVFDGDDLQNADRKVRYYLTENLDHLVDVEEENGSKRFALKEDAVFFGSGRMEVLTQVAGQQVLGGEIEDGEDFEEVTVPFGPSMVFKKESEGYSVAALELSDDE